MESLMKYIKNIVANILWVVFVPFALIMLIQTGILHGMQFVLDNITKIIYQLKRK